MTRVSTMAANSLFQTTHGTKSLGGGHFVGQMESAPNGPGTAHFLFRDHRDVYDGPSMKYDGQWHQGGRHGYGSSAAVSGTKYLGEYHKDKRQGAGKEQFQIGASYDGDYDDGVESGQGTAVSVDGSKYSGEFKDGLRDGEGMFRCADGATYIGSYVKGLRHGHGKFEWADGSCYDGEYHHDHRHGQGVYTWADGRRYNGGFKHNCRHGDGEFTFASGDKFVGKYEDDCRKGRGALFYKSGEVDRGCWKGRFLVKVENVQPEETQGPQSRAAKMFLQATRDGDAAHLNQLLMSGTVSIDVCDNDGRSALYFASMRGDSAAIKSLLCEGARVNMLTTNGVSIVSQVYRESGLINESIEKRTHLREAVMMLLDEGADPNVSTHPKPILRLAIAQADVLMVNKLIAKGSDLAYCDQLRQRTALHDAGMHYAKCERTDAILCKWRTADSKARGRSVVDCSTEKTTNALEVAITLVDAGASVTSIDYEGLTILHIAAGVKGDGAWALLDRIFKSDRTVDINGLWRVSKTPLSIAVTAGNDKLAFELLNRGADPNTRLKNNRVTMCDLLEEHSLEVRTVEERLSLAIAMIKCGADVLTLVPVQLITTTPPPPTQTPPTNDTTTTTGTTSTATTPTTTTPPTTTTATMTGLLIDQVYAHLQGNKKKLQLAGNDKQLMDVLLDAMRACHHERFDNALELVPFCYECGRSIGVRLHTFKSSPVIHFCSDRCEMRALNRGHLKWCSKVEGSVRWRPSKTSSDMKPTPLAFKSTGHMDAEDRDSTLRDAGSRISTLHMTRQQPLPSIGSGYVPESNPPHTYRAVNQTRVPGIGSKVSGPQPE